MRKPIARPCARMASTSAMAPLEAFDARDAAQGYQVAVTFQPGDVRWSSGNRREEHLGVAAVQFPLALAGPCRIDQGTIAGDALARHRLQGVGVAVVEAQHAGDTMEPA